MLDCYISAVVHVVSKTQGHSVLICFGFVPVLGCCHYWRWRGVYVRMLLAVYRVSCSMHSYSTQAIQKGKIHTLVWCLLAAGSPLVSSSAWRNKNKHLGSWMTSHLCDSHVWVFSFLHCAFKAHLTETTCFQT